MPQTECLQQQEFISLQFWRLEVQGQDAIRVGFLVRPLFLAWGCWELGGWRDGGRERGGSGGVAMRLTEGLRGKVDQGGAVQTGLHVEGASAFLQ